MLEYMDRFSGRRIVSVAMMTNSILPLFVVLASSLSALGCIAAEGATDSDESLDSVQQPVLSSNALSNNALSNNALSNNALSNNALVMSALTDPKARELLKYVVSCALKPADSVEFTVNGVNYSYPGELGLAASWGKPNGKCDATCKGWVSACVISRVDFAGEKVSVSLRGDHPALATTKAERASHTFREGAYYGNIFGAPNSQVYYACSSPGNVGIPRVCGPSNDDCVVDVVGSCNHTCNGPSQDGSYNDCRDEARSGCGFPQGSKVYPQTITVFLKP